MNETYTRTIPAADSKFTFQDHVTNNEWDFVTIDGDAVSCDSKYAEALDRIIEVWVKGLDPDYTDIEIDEVKLQNWLDNKFPELNNI